MLVLLSAAKLRCSQLSSLTVRQQPPRSEWEPHIRYGIYDKFRSRVHLDMIILLSHSLPFSHTLSHTHTLTHSHTLSPPISPPPETSRASCSPTDYPNHVLVPPGEDNARYLHAFVSWRIVTAKPDGRARTRDVRCFGVSRHGLGPDAGYFGPHFVSDIRAVHSLLLSWKPLSPGVRDKTFTAMARLALPQFPPPGT